MIRRALFAALLVPAAALAASPMQPGQWDSTVSVARPGRVPLISNSSDCVTQKDIDDGSKSLPKPGDDCELANVATEEGKTTYDFSCRDGGVLRTGRATFVIEATRYDGKLDVTSRKANAPEVTSSLTWTAHRVGECK
jgi:Protein of unknown function (DUF3617)